MLLTGFELDAALKLLNGQATGTIKDLMLVQKTVDKIKAVIPAFPVEPKFEAFVAEGKEDQYQIAKEQWDKDCVSFYNTEHECPLGESDCMIIRNKMLAFQQFNNEEKVRVRLIAMAQKFNIF